MAALRPREVGVSAVLLVFPPAEDEAERAMDEVPVRLELRIEPDLYRQLCEERSRRRRRGERTSMRAIIVEALRVHLER